ncbi:MAG: hypothetical protein R6U51_05835, partial [Anaerolineales bacterium]
MQKWTSKDMITQGQIVTKLGLSPSKFHDWVKRYGNKNQHNAPIPRWFWLMESEKEAILEYYEDYPEEGYRRLSFMMLDENVAAVSPSSVYRVLKRAGKLGRWSKKIPGKG